MDGGRPPAGDLRRRSAGMDHVELGAGGDDNPGQTSETTEREPSIPTRCLALTANSLCPVRPCSWATLPDSWVEQARGPVTAFTGNSVTISGPDLSSVGYTTAPAAPATTFPTPVVSRVVLLGYNNLAVNPITNVKASETRIITGVNAATGVVSWGGPTNADGLGPTFTPVAARVETQDRRYTWMLTVHANPPAPTGGPSWNVTVTVFFNRPLVANDEQVCTRRREPTVCRLFHRQLPRGPEAVLQEGGLPVRLLFRPLVSHRQHGERHGLAGANLRRQRTAAERRHHQLENFGVLSHAGRRGRIPSLWALK